MLCGDFLYTLSRVDFAGSYEDKRDHLGMEGIILSACVFICAE